jgi:hypothetical protein
VLALAACAASALLTLALASCGGSYSARPPIGTATPGQTRFAYLYSRLDYPLQVAVSSGDTVTLLLSPQSNILSVTPAAGRGSGTVGNPIPLPTDLENYRDIAAAVDTRGPADGPFAWQLTSPVRQSLLTSQDPSTPRDYRDVSFQWHVQAVAPGQNVVQILLHLVFVYLDGSEQNGTIEVTQAPIPLVAVEASPLNTALPQFKLPLVGASSLAGLIAIFRFLIGAFKTMSDVTGPVKDAAKVAQTVRAHVSSIQGSQMPNTPTWQPSAPPPPAPLPLPYPPYTEEVTRPATRRPWPPMPSDQAPRDPRR